MAQSELGETGINAAFAPFLSQRAYSTAAPQFWRTRLEQASPKKTFDHYQIWSAGLIGEGAKLDLATERQLPGML